MSIEQRPSPRATLRAMSRLAAKGVIRPKVLIPLTLSAGILIALLAFANIQDVLAEIFSFQPVDILWYAGFFAIYELGRWLLWHFLVVSQGERIRVRVQVLSFLMGEVSKNLPLGNYFPNYVLKQAAGADFGFTSSITTAIVLCEVTVSLLGVTILGVGSWTGWLRAVILIGAPLFVFGVWAVIRLRRSAGAPAWMTRTKSLRRLLEELRQFRAGAERLWHPRVVVIALIICAVYVTAGGVALYAIVRGLHVSTLSVPQVIAVYCFSLAFALIEPSPVDIGLTEAGGAGAFLAFGVHLDLAVTAMLINRVFNVGFTLVFVAIGLIVLHDDVRALMRSRATPPEVSAEDGTSRMPPDSQALPTG